jgi:transketolase
LDFSSGSLGHGLSVAAGIAYGLKQMGSLERVFVILSDGECQEGSTWEAAQFASHHKLSNLTCLVDVNGLQAMGATDNILTQKMLPERFAAFGFTVLTIDGHDIGAVCDSLDATGRDIDGPTVVLAKTIKGKGVSFMENDLNWHYLPLSDEQAEMAWRELSSS